MTDGIVTFMTYHKDRQRHHTMMMSKPEWLSELWDA
jgi:hypothetical protein